MRFKIVIFLFGLVFLTGFSEEIGNQNLKILEQKISGKEMELERVFIQIEGQIHTFISNPELPKDLFMNTGIIPTIHNINHSRALLLESDNAKSTTLSKVKISESNLRM